MFEAGSIIFNIRAAGAQVFKQEMTGAEQAAKQAGTAVGTAGDKTEELGKKQDQVVPKTKTFRQELSGLSEDGKRAAREVGGALVAVGAGFLAMSALTVKAAVGWESAWAGVTKTVDGTPQELKDVEDGLRSLTGVLPASHQEIAAVAEAAGQLGVQTKNVVAFTKTMIDLGETTNLSANEAATSLARFMNVMGTSQSRCPTSVPRSSSWATTTPPLRPKL